MKAGGSPLSLIQHQWRLARGSVHWRWCFFSRKYSEKNYCLCKLTVCGPYYSTQSYIMRFFATEIFTSRKLQCASLLLAVPCLSNRGGEPLPWPRPACCL